MKTLCRSLACFIVALLLLPMVSTTLADTGSSVQLTGKANVRKAPSLDGEILGTLNSGATAAYLGESATDDRGVAWYKITFKNGAGWISSKYAKIVSSAPSVSSEFQPYTVKVTSSALAIRKGPGTDTEKVGSIQDKGIYTIVEEAKGPGATKWGKLKSGAGWISLDYTQKYTPAAATPTAKPPSVPAPTATPTAVPASPAAEIFYAYIIEMFMRTDGQTDVVFKHALWLFGDEAAAAYMNDHPEVSWQHAVEEVEEYGYIYYDEPGFRRYTTTADSRYFLWDPSMNTVESVEVHYDTFRYIMFPVAEAREEWSKLFVKVSASGDKIVSIEWVYTP